MRITMVGHMTARIELDGRAFLTDPWFGPRGYLERLLAPRAVPPALTPDRLGPIDALLVSHDHLDHLDEVSLDFARRAGCAVIGSEKAARRAQRAGVRETVALRRGESITLGPVTVHAVWAGHPLAADAVGFVLTGSCTLYFSGDTRRTPALVEDLQRFSLDVALVQAACAHYPLIGDDGMSLPDVAALAREVRPRWTVPVHLHCAGKWLDRAAGLRVTMDNAAQVATALSEWASSLQAEGLGVKVLAPGETWEI